MFGTYSQYQRLITDYYGSKNQVISVEKLENGMTRAIQTTGFLIVIFFLNGSDG